MNVLISIAVVIVIMAVAYTVYVGRTSGMAATTAATAAGTTATTAATAANGTAVTAPTPAQSCSTATGVYYFMNCAPGATGVSSAQFGDACAFAYNDWNAQTADQQAAWGPQQVLQNTAACSQDFTGAYCSKLDPVAASQNAVCAGNATMCNNLWNAWVAMTPAQRSAAGITDIMGALTAAKCSADFLPQYCSLDDPLDAVITWDCSDPAVCAAADAEFAASGQAAIQNGALKMLASTCYRNDNTLFQPAICGAVSAQDGCQKYGCAASCLALQKAACPLNCAGMQTQLQNYLETQTALSGNSYVQVTSAQNGADGQSCDVRFVYYPYMMSNTAMGVDTENIAVTTDYADCTSTLSLERDLSPLLQYPASQPANSIAVPANSIAVPAGAPAAPAAPAAAPSVVVAAAAPASAATATNNITPVVVPLATGASGSGASAAATTVSPAAASTNNITPAIVPLVSSSVVSTDSSTPVLVQVYASSGTGAGAGKVSKPATKASFAAARNRATTVQPRNDGAMTMHAAR